MMNYLMHKIFMLTRLGGMSNITMPIFFKTGLSKAEILLFFDFPNGRRRHLLFLKLPNFLANAVMAGDAILDFQICEISLADSVWKAQTHHCAKCRQN